ncbi:MAG: 4Fe-4S dicluster domain-containing protein [Candidatus Stygibacter australis]|nr:4Fe-4S dicluster domain-containing protein [Candidatus Stygibacter australis]MDP8323061.1 4Fe-4S dicluster domain-containing protein [Candidatus Stygibacter australis]
MIVIKPEYCSKDNKCQVISFCPAEAVTHEPGKVPQIDYQKCTECRKCLYFCPAFCEIIED